MGDDSSQPKSLLNMLGQGLSDMLNNNIKHLHSNAQSRIDDQMKGKAFSIKSIE